MADNLSGNIFSRLYAGTKPLRRAVRSFLLLLVRRRETRKMRRFASSCQAPKIYWLGVPDHSNLGDIAQYLCIKDWMTQYCPEYQVFEAGAKTVADSRCGFVETLARVYTERDVIVFQSGYCTQDLGGSHDLMHRLVCESLPQARILMLPQTVFFGSSDNRRRTSVSYNRARRMLFLARDKVSYEMALQMFPDIRVMLYPDIVTTLIGTIPFREPKSGILLCTRHDGEKYYSESQLETLATRLSEIDTVRRTDTISKMNYRRILADCRHILLEEFRKYASARVVITDKYHGTVFSLLAGTPVVILRTTDHKVVTGAQWFEGICDGWFRVASSLEEAESLARSIFRDGAFPGSPAPEGCPKPHFRDNYYGSGLRELMDNL